MKFCVKTVQIRDKNAHLIIVITAKHRLVKLLTSNVGLHSLLSEVTSWMTQCCHCQVSLNNNNNNTRRVAVYLGDTLQYRLEESVSK